ncbi:LysR substrate-binding domain-containing protein [Rheinheimera sp.]|uniref:LysR substrate-binding domain-containing protein n=1 Tax=Rheinheimera sp. TaxID=1869214 RepID=UPI0027B89C69|nr:LysR substrate-binding domain-containing protein [Rheinheimera sp.]
MNKISDNNIKNNTAAEIPNPSQLSHSPVQLPPLKALLAFEATARLFSFSRAAAELCVTQSAISHQIRLLEDFIGTPLLLRQHKPLALTEAGATLYSVVGDCFFRLQSVTHHLRKSKNRVLKIVAQTSIAVEWLAPRLPLFQQQHPDIETLLHMESSASSLDANAFDVVIGTWPTPAGFVSQRIRTEWWFPVCAPAQYELLDLTQPSSVFAYPLYSSEQGEDWQLWRQQMQLREPAKTEMSQVSLALLATKAVTCGKGLALSNSFIAGDAIRQGQLKALTHWRYQLPWGQYQLHYRQDSLSRNAIAVFNHWLLQQAELSLLTELKTTD